MRLVASLLVTTAALTALAAAPPAQQRWSGTISDSSCRATHEAGGEAGLPDEPEDCVIACVRGGSKFVLVTDDKKVYLIADQDDPALPAHAGAKVTVTGTLADTVLTIAKIDKR